MTTFENQKEKGNPHIQPEMKMEQIQEIPLNSPIKNKEKVPRRQSTPNVKNKPNKLYDNADDKRASCQTAEMFGNRNIRQRNYADLNKKNDVNAS